MRLSFRQLEILQLFSRTLSVTETARLIRVSQPAVSQTIREIEAQLGFAIILRVGNRVRLTDEARALLPEVERILAQMTSLSGHAEALRDARAGSLTIAAIPTLFSELLPAAIARFMAEHAKVNLRAEVEGAFDVVRRIRQDTAHIGFAFLPLDETGIAAHPIMRMSAVCVVPPGNPLAQRSVVHARDLRNELVIIQDVHSPAGMLINEQIEEELSGTRLLRVNQSIGALRLVNADIGVAIAHPLTVSGGVIGNGVAVRLEPQVNMVLAMIYPRQKAVPRIVLRFERHFRAAAEEFARKMAAGGYDCEMLI